MKTPEFSDISPRSHLLQLKEDLYKWVEEKDKVVEVLNDMANNLDAHSKRMLTARAGGRAAAISGGILAAVGVGLSFFTLGASLGLTIAGGAIAAAGDRNVITVKTDAVLSKSKRNSAEEILAKYKSRVEGLKKECVEIGALLKEYGNIEESFPFWIRVWAKLVLGETTKAKNIGWDIIAHTVLDSLELASNTDVGARSEVTAFKTIGSTAGSVFGILLLPIDIKTLMDSLDVQKNNAHEASEGIRIMVAKMTKACPSINEIDSMIEETLHSVLKLSIGSVPPMEEFWWY